MKNHEALEIPKLAKYKLYKFYVFLSFYTLALRLSIFTIDLLTSLALSSYNIR